MVPVGSPEICPSLARLGTTCTTPDCPYNHTVFGCDRCSKFFATAEELRTHEQSRLHQNGPSGHLVPCEVCGCDVMPQSLGQHSKGRRHKEGLRRLREAPVHSRNISSGSLAAYAPADIVRCTICDRDVPSHGWTLHLENRTHKMKASYQNYQRALEEGYKDKNGIVITESELNFGEVDIRSLRNKPTIDKLFHILPRERPVRLVSAKMSSTAGPHARFRPVNFKSGFVSPRLLKNGLSHSLLVTFDPQGNLGEFDDRIEFVFEDYTLRIRFSIFRAVKGVVANREDAVALAAAAPYVPRQPRKLEPEGEVVDGVRPPELAAITWVKELPWAPVPKFIQALIQDGPLAKKLNVVRQRMLPQTISVNTYSKHWQMLLWLEELQTSTDMEQYDQTDVSFAATGNGYHFLEIPGLAEKRPSVIIGDSIQVRAHGSPGARWYRGYVHNVEQTQVVLKFAPTFNAFRGQKFDVRFELNRLVFRRMHQALLESFSQERVIIPEMVDVQDARMARPSTAALAKYRPFDRPVQTNPAQWQGVVAIAELRPGATPFVVFGPPGTGKTVTIIEAINQLLLKSRNNKILACAPSNSAADILAERLSKVLNKSELFRMNAPTRLKETLSPALNDYSLVNQKGSFAVPPLAKLKSYRVVVSTCLSASVPFGVGVPPGHFTHIFVDEAGQASEPDIMVPVRLNAGPGTNIVLAGDPKQLGPIIRSPLSNKLGLGMSWLDRLMALPLYDPSTMGGITVVKLKKNWRSHASILKFPNDEFYKGELVANASPVIVDSCLRWWCLPNPTFPIIFHAIKGKDQRQASSPSFFNIPEASAVRDYIRDLREDSGLRISDNLMGVISPYNAQCQKIRTLLRQSNPGVKVGSVEEFQGQERRVIFISTVRSSVDYVEFDLRHTLGFVANPRRFNVAMTRAQALLVIVGDPDVLGLDPLWRSFLNYIYRNRGWKGQTIPWDPAEPVERSVGRNGAGLDEQRRMQTQDEMDDLVTRTRALILDSVPLDEEEEEAAELRRLEAVPDQPWREEE